ncbi:AraC family transcriptional regulator [Streptomyces sp. NPDC020192]|uniref:AraC family transcriptional regulator n=1 Tax=Streptomyces sp. NPDC020192 TaxID=3365066 RepID=UPI0037A9F4D5
MGDRCRRDRTDAGVRPLGGAAVLRRPRTARELVRGGARVPTVAAVAQRWCFVNPDHFRRVFRGAYGHSPREWRRLRTCVPAPHPEHGTAAPDCARDTATRADARHDRPETPLRRPAGAAATAYAEASDPDSASLAAAGSAAAARV